MPLDLRYLQYCQPGVAFYSAPPASEAVDAFTPAPATPSAWESDVHGPWRNWRRRGTHLARQGWKIHVSATLNNAQQILDRTAAYCFTAGLCFKHLTTPEHVLRQNEKYADRASSGKFITVYPGHDDDFVAAVRELGTILDGFEGPYILSDRRWGAGPVHFRYGAFVPPADDSPFTTTLLTPSGQEVEDERRPAFTPPAWAALPLALHLPSEQSGDAFPFDVVSALHFSNGGGVYRARATTDEFVDTGRLVVLKEARPHAGLDREGTDAVARLQHEETVLRALQGLPCVPGLFGSFTAWEHRYLVLEHLDGHDLKREWMRRTPVLQPAPWTPDPDFGAWLTGTVVRLEEGLRAVHDAGWLLGDIHPKNIMMRNGTEPCFIDFEFAERVGAGRRCPQGAPGYEPAQGLVDADADRWSLGVVELDLLLPQATLADQGNIGKIEQVLDHAERTVPGAREVRTTIRSNTLDLLDADVVRRSVGRHAEIDGLTHQAFRDEVRRGLGSMLDWTVPRVAAPGDIVLLETSGSAQGSAFPHGAAGVVRSLRPEPGSRCHRSADRWIAERVRFLDAAGLSGWHGVQDAARSAGLDQTSAALAGLRKAAPSGGSLWCGWAGAGLAAIADGDDPSEASHHLERMLGDDPEPTETVGLLHGWCAAGIFFSRLFVRTGDERHLRLAVRAIELDLARCTTTSNGTLEFDEGWRTLPYLGVGSLGPGLAIIELQRATRSDLFSEELALIDRAATYRQCAHASVAHGLAGFIVYLVRRIAHCPDARLTAVLDTHLTSLRLHAVADRAGVQFRGNQNLRLSTDYLTGSAGVLAALDEVLDGRRSLPFDL